jgi:acetyltransferase
LANARQVSSAFEEMLEQVRCKQPSAKIDGVSIQPMLKFADAREVLVGVSRDPVFGPVLAFGTGGIAVEAMRDLALALPPLNSMLANELIRATRISRVLSSYRTVPAIDLAALVTVLLRVSTIACLLPWIRELDLNPVLAHPLGAVVLDARIVIDADAPMTDPRYRHMAIFPYPVEQEHDLQLADGAVLHVRAVRPDDASRERAFMAELSDASRYARFLHAVNALSDEMVARFTQIDYDREMALIALAPATVEEDAKIAGVARYYANSDRTSAEFAIAIGDQWQGRGLGEALMRSLIATARAAGYRNMNGIVLEQNVAMLKLAASLGFTVRPSETTADTVTIELALD